MNKYTKKFDKGLVILAGIVTGLILAYVASCFVQPVCAGYKSCTDHSYVSPIPTDTIVSPSSILSPSAGISPSVIPSISLQPTLQLSPTILQPTPTPQTQIGTSASADNTQSAGSSASNSPSSPTSAPDTGRAASTVQGLQPYITPLPGPAGWK